MNHGQSETIADDVTLDADRKSKPTIAVIALRFVGLLFAIIAAFAWAWSR